MSNGIKEYQVKLTEADYAVLESYEIMCDALSEYLGDGYEIVLHSLGEDDYFIRKIIKGHYSNRTVGSAADNYPLRIIERIIQQHESGGTASSVYFSDNHKGELFRTMSAGIFGAGGRLIGLLCINFYMDTPLSHIVQQLYPTSEVIRKKTGADEEQSFSEIIERVVAAAEESVMADTSIPPKLRRREVIRRLFDAGIFDLKGSVAACAKLMGIQASTIYMHIRRLNKKI